jgi:hypothetical protein
MQTDLSILFCILYFSESNSAKCGVQSSGSDEESKEKMAKMQNSLDMDVSTTPLCVSGKVNRLKVFPENIRNSSMSKEESLLSW